ncbi:hypothetical protein CSA56_01740 [candidate division KSB3 bacterium]|uniref:Uncharacterized protein n=1 Tax=candidate division KSB3 bacterium TaxID=2044937 RepID=A0A2G6KK39_9BACT|nr:MAG: hypothetical protein CSA56_01740 [candidate division KSB3 bacterium]
MFTSFFIVRGAIALILILNMAILHFFFASKDKKELIKAKQPHHVRNETSPALSQTVRQALCHFWPVW